MFAIGDKVEIVDDDLLYNASGSLSKHYQKGTVAIVTELFLDMISIQSHENVSSILLLPKEFKAIRKVGDKHE